MSTYRQRIFKPLYGSGIGTGISGLPASSMNTLVVLLGLAAVAVAQPGKRHAICCFVFLFIYFFIFL